MNFAPINWTPKIERPVVSGKATCKSIYLSNPVKVRTVMKPARLPTTCQIKKTFQFSPRDESLKLVLARILNTRLERTKGIMIRDTFSIFGMVSGSFPECETLKGQINRIYRLAIEPDDSGN